ncbi:glycoside hydrolase superfamily, partial [Dimargaris cristalligena]
LTASTAAFDLDSSSNLVTYWGQNSYGVTHPGAGGAERSLEEYCQNDSPSDVFVLAFLQIFNAGTNKPPVLDFSDQCKTTFPGSELLRCPSIARGIKTCQAKGKAVLLSLGGAVGLYGFRSNDEGRQFARTIWNMFFAGGLDYPPDGPPSNSQASLRPLGDVILDGIDLDIEGGSPTGYAAFIETLRGYFQADAARKRYYVAAAPQCAFPDFYMQPILEKAWFDMLYIQFYNNYCGLNNPSAYNYQVWHEWAQTKAINKNVKLYVGVPGGPTGASTGFVTMDQLRPVLDDTRAKFDSFGGVMMWDTSQA